MAAGAEAAEGGCTVSSAKYFECFFLFGFQDRISLRSPSCPGTRSVNRLACLPLPPEWGD